MGVGLWEKLTTLAPCWPHFAEPPSLCKVGLCDPQKRTEVTAHHCLGLVTQPGMALITCSGGRLGDRASTQGLWPAAPGPLWLSLALVKPTACPRPPEQPQPGGFSIPDFQKMLAGRNPGGFKPLTWKEGGGLFIQQRTTNI